MKASFVLNLLHVSHDKQHPVKVEYDSSRDQILQFLKTLPLQFIYYHFVQQYPSSTRARTHTPTLPHPPTPSPKKKKKNPNNRTRLVLESGYNEMTTSW